MATVEKKFIERGVSGNLHYAVYISPKMKKPLVAVSKYPLQMMEELKEKVLLYKKHKK